MRRPRARRARRAGPGRRRRASTRAPRGDRDYLLGQQDEAQRAATHAFLGGLRRRPRVGAGRRRRAARPRRRPAAEIPGEGRDDGAAARAPRPRPSAAAPAASGATTPASRREATTPRRDRAARHRHRRVRRPRRPALLAPRRRAPARRPRDRRGRGRPVLRPARRRRRRQSPAPAASTTATQPQAKVEAQVNLVPPDSRKNLKALGVVLVQRAQNQDQIVAAVQGLPKPKSGGYGIWLYSGPGKAQWLGFFASQDNQGRLLARGQLKTPIAGYREILVTREAKGNPARPGPIYLARPDQDGVEHLRRRLTALPTPGSRRAGGRAPRARRPATAPGSPARP